VTTSPTFTPNGVDHVALNVPDVPAAITFYTEVLGLTQNFTRPDFGFPGAWLDAGPQQVHLIELEAPPNLGQHFALLYDSVVEMVAHLRGLGLEVTDPVINGAGRTQAFVSDPWGNGIEIHQLPG
jgi:catechol 2,3-dioxygenase-like lactoylglutathione lyase family enzyme